MSRITYFEWLNASDRRDTYRVHIRTALEGDELRALIEEALDPEPVTLEQLGLAAVAAAEAADADRFSSTVSDEQMVFYDLVQRYRQQDKQ